MYSCGVSQNIDMCHYVCMYDDTQVNGETFHTVGCGLYVTKNIWTVIRTSEVHMYVQTQIGFDLKSEMCISE